MNEKAQEEAERGNALRMSSPGKRVARKLGAEGCVPPRTWGQVLDVPWHGDVQELVSTKAMR
jgi:hypothetical protein